MIRLIALLLLSSICCAQSSGSSKASGNGTSQSFVLGELHAGGSKRFSETEILKATGLKSGSKVTVDELKQVADSLAQCGVFSNITFRYNGVAVDYTVVDAAQLVPATFENFIWFSDGDLIRRLRELVPLFNGNVPLSGNLPDQVSSALDALLKEKGIAGHTTSMMQ